MCSGWVGGAEAPLAPPLATSLVVMKKNSVLTTRSYYSAYNYFHDKFSQITRKII